MSANDQGVVGSGFGAEATSAGTVPSMATLLAHISDPHIVAEGELLGGILDTAAYLAAAVEHINAMAATVDGVLITGDLTNDGHVEQYRHLVTILERLEVPWWALYGNHDIPRTGTPVLRDHLPRGVQSSGCGIVQIGDVDVFTLNTGVPGAPGGELQQHELAWLNDQLNSSSAVHRVVAMHHPPAAVGIAGMDAMALNVDSAATLDATVLYRHRIDAILCGHLHRMTVTSFGGTVAISAPSVAHAIAFDLDPDAALAFSLEPPAMLVHRFDNGAMSTHHSAIGEFPSRPVGE